MKTVLSKGLAAAALILMWALPAAAQDEIYGDLYLYSLKSCQGQDLSKAFFPNIAVKDRQIVDAITNEMLFYDVLQYLTDGDSNRTSEALQSNEAHNVRSSPELTRQKQLMAQSTHSDRLIDYANRKRANSIRMAHEFFAKAAKSNPLFGAVIHNLFVCKAIRNSRHLLPPIQQQFEAAARHQLPPQPPSPNQDSYGGNCSCAGGNVCFGPRGGRFCITSGGNKRYGI